MEPFWTPINEPVLRQGDLLPGCSIPEFPPDFAVDAKAALLVQVDQADLIVIMQSCDLEHGGLSLVAMCPVWSIPAFEAAQATHGRGKSGKAWHDFPSCRASRRPLALAVAVPGAFFASVRAIFHARWPALVGSGILTGHAPQGAPKPTFRRTTAEPEGSYKLLQQNSWVDFGPRPPPPALERRRPPG